MVTTSLDFGFWVRKRFERIQIRKVRELWNNRKIHLGLKLLHENACLESMNLRNPSTIDRELPVTLEQIKQEALQIKAKFFKKDQQTTDVFSIFTSGEFRDFCETYQIEHITTPPYHPMSNGQAERFEDILMRTLKKARATPNERALQQFLQVYRLHQITKRQPHNLQPRWCSYVGYGPFTTNYSWNRRILEEHAS